MSTPASSTEIETRKIQALMIPADGTVPRFVEIETKEVRNEFGGTSTRLVRMADVIDPVYGKRGLSITLFRGLSGGTMFPDPFLCYHKDLSEPEGLVINKCIQGWQRELIGRDGHPWMGNVVMVKTPAWSLGDVVKDVNEEDIPALKEFFAKFGIISQSNIHMSWV